MPGGIVHVGLNTTYVISDLKIGVSRYGLPTTTREVQIGSLSRKYGHIETGDIDQHELALDLVQHPAAAFEIEPDLVDTRGHRHVECGQRPWSDGPVRAEAVTLLEVPHTGLDLRVVDVSGIRDRGIAAGLSAVATSPAVDAASAGAAGAAAGARAAGPP